MAKAKAYYSYLLCFLICCGAAGTRAVAQEVCAESKVICSEANESSIRARVQQVYLAEVGVREQGGANRGKRVEQYLAATGLGSGYAWCASFVTWCYLQAEVEAPVSAWVPSFALRDHIIYQRSKRQLRAPQTGDVFMIWYERLNRPAHIGFIDKWGEQYVVTVEGNTNDTGGREGDGVYRKRRLKRQVWAVSDFISVR